MTISVMLEMDSAVGAAKPVARMLQHAILQLCNEHVGYGNKLQILGVLCLTVDDEQQEIVVKVNNTLKRVNPPPVVASVLPSDGSLNFGYIANGVFPRNGGSSKSAVTTQDSALSSLCVQQVTSLANTTRPSFVCDNQLNAALQENDAALSSPEVVLVDKDTSDGTSKVSQSATKRSGGRRKTTPFKAQNFDDNTNPLCDEDVTTILPVDPDELPQLVSKSFESYAQHSSKGKNFSAPQKARDGGKANAKGRSKTPQRDAGSLQRTQNSVSPASSTYTSLNNMATIRALLSAASSSSTFAPNNGKDSTIQAAVGLTQARGTQGYGMQNVIVPRSQFATLLDGSQFNLQQVLTLDLGSAGATLLNSNVLQGRGSNRGDAVTGDSNVPIMVEEIKEEAKDDYFMSSDTEMNVTTGGTDDEEEGELQIVGMVPERQHRKQHQGDIISGIANRLAFESIRSGSNGASEESLSLVHGSASTSSSTPKKVKDMIMFNDGLVLNKGGIRYEADTADFMMDQLGSGETRRRRRRGPYTECLTLEEIAEYMGPRDPGAISFQCRYCAESTTNLAQYLHHTFTAHSAYICHECGKHFTTKSSLLRHRPIHTGMRRFVCSFCQKTFYRKDKCKAHIKRHLGTTENVQDFDDSLRLDEGMKFEEGVKLEEDVEQAVMMQQVA